MPTVKFEIQRYEKNSTKIFETDSDINEIINSFINYNEPKNIEEVSNNKKLENIEERFFSKICQTDFYFGKMSYGEWKSEHESESEYFVGGYIYLVSQKIEDGYIYSIIHQKYSEDDFDRYGVLSITHGTCDIYNSESTHTTNKKAIIISSNSLNELELLKNIHNIKKIEDIKKYISNI